MYRDTLITWRDAAWHPVLGYNTTLGGYPEGTIGSVTVGRLTTWTWEFTAVEESFYYSGWPE